MKHSVSMLYIVVLLLFATMTAATVPVNSECELEGFILLADDYHAHHNFVVDIRDHDYFTWSLHQSDGIYGNFEVTYPASGGDQIIDFFICTEENYNLWDSGESASVYHLQQNVASYSFEFRVPSYDTWYLVFINFAYLTSKTIDFNLYRDDTAPTIDLNLDAGASYSGIKTITATITEATFDIGTVELRIDGVLKDTEYDSSFSYSWDTTQYSNGAHTIRISASDNVGNSDYETVTVYVSNSVTDGTTDGTTDGGGYTGQPMNTTTIMLGAVGLVAIIGIAIVASRRGKGGPAPADVFTPAPPPPDEPTPAPAKDTAPADAVTPAQRPSEESESTHFREREVVTEKFLVICPFCGAKNQQGIVKCQKCHADL